MKDEYVECTMSENTATLLGEPSVLVPFTLKLCNIWQYFAASAFNFVSCNPGQGLELFTRSTSTQKLK